MKKLYFAYGSNLNLKQMRQRCPDSKVYSAAILKDYSLVFRGVADIVKEKKQKVQGILFEVSKNDIVKLDAYEGYPMLYKRIKIVVNIGNKEVEAFAYKMVNGYSFELPDKGYFDIIYEGYLNNSLNTKHLMQGLIDVLNYNYQTGLQINL